MTHSFPLLKEASWFVGLLQCHVTNGRMLSAVSNCMYCMIGLWDFGEDPIQPRQQ